MGRAMIDLYCESFHKVPDRIILDIDDTFDAVHGGQQLRLFNAHYDEYGFQPIVVFDGEGRFITAVLRPAKRPRGKEIKAFLRRLLRAIRANWPGTRITLRADSHYCCPETLDFCRANGLDYILGVAPTTTLRKHIGELEARVKAQDAAAPKKGKARRFKEFYDGAKSWSRVERIIARVEAWRALLDDLVKRGMQTPDLVMVDGGKGLDAALAALWTNVPVQRCTVHKHRNLLAHAPERLHEEISADYTDMIYAATKAEIETRRKAFIRKWRLKHRAVADSLEEAGDRLFTFARFPPDQWRSIRTTNAIERLHEEFKRRIKTQTVLPSAETAAMLFWALLASGQITMRKVDGWKTLADKPSDQPIDLAA